MPSQFAANYQGQSENLHYHLFRNPEERLFRFKKNKLRRLAVKNGYQLGLAFLLSRFMVSGEILPAGLALGIVSTYLQFTLVEKIIILFGIFLGTWSKKNLPFAIGLTSCLVLVLLSSCIFSQLTRTSSKRSYYFIILTILRFGLTAIWEPTYFGFGMTGLELILVYILMLFFQTVFTFLENPLKAFSKITLPAFGIIAVLTLAGLRNFSFHSVYISEILVIVFLMITAYIGGGGMGAVMGIFIGMVFGANTENFMAGVATYGIIGLLAGLLKDWRKWGVILGAGLGLFLVLHHFHYTMGANLKLIPWGIGLVAFVFIPRRSLTQIANYLPNQSLRTGSTETQRQFRELITNRLHGLAEIFEELAKTFNENNLTQPEQQKMDLYSLLDQVCTKNCQHCTGYDNCWGENFYSTYREVFDLVAYAELYGEVNSKHIKGRLGKNCFQQFKLLATINQLFEKCQTDIKWFRKFEESKTFLANQLEGVSGIVSNLAAEITIDANFKTEVEDNIYNGLNRIGMAVKEITVLSFHDQGLEINIKQHCCNQKHECQYLAAAMIGRLLDQEYMVWERNCHLEKDTCSYCLTPTRNYEVKTTVCKIPKHGNEFSGDNHGIHELKDGYFVAILSDGMGHGSKASIESSTTVKFLEKLLESQIDSEFAVKMVNSILLLRSPEESFATVDLVLIDLFTARAEFIKIGAAVTYVKRGREVLSIQSTSLPAGILNNIELERTELELKPGDFIVMATDGIVDSRPSQPDKEDWMIRALRQVEVAGPEALGEYLLNMAKINQEGIPMDDMSVIVLQINEKQISI